MDTKDIKGPQKGKIFDLTKQSDELWGTAGVAQNKGPNQKLGLRSKGSENMSMGSALRLKTQLTVSYSL